MNTGHIISQANEFFGTDVTQTTKFKAPLWDAKCSVVRYLVADMQIPYKDLKNVFNCTSNELWFLRVHGDNKMMVPAFRSKYTEFVSSLTP